MRLLFLRGQVPSDRNPREIMFDRLEDCDDVWIQLAYQLVKITGGYGEVWYEKGKRVTRYNHQLLERWTRSWATTACDFKPDVIFARGGFKIMRREAERHRGAYKIHYGAGQRVVPAPNHPWDLVLVDTLKQLDRARKNGYNAQMFIKPAADNVFYPRSAFNKKYDVIYVANWNPNADKGHRFLLPALREYRVLHVGYNRRGWSAKFPHTDFQGWVPRHQLPELYAQAKLAVIMTIGKDSCPRVIPEALACGCPVVIFRDTRIWHEMYVTAQTGTLFTKDSFLPTLNAALDDWRRYHPREYYEKHLSLPVAARHVISLMEAT